MIDPDELSTEPEDGKQDTPTEGKKTGIPDKGTPNLNEGMRILDADEGMDHPNDGASSATSEGAPDRDAQGGATATTPTGVAQDPSIARCSSTL
jgi:hypothetical protein